jgi:hypothetical protein
MTVSSYSGAVSGFGLESARPQLPEAVWVAISHNARPPAKKAHSHLVEPPTFDTLRPIGGTKTLQLIPPEATGKATEHFKHQVCGQQCSIPGGVILWRHLY